MRSTNRSSCGRTSLEYTVSITFTIAYVDIYMWVDIRSEGREVFVNDYRLSSVPLRVIIGRESTFLAGIMPRRLVNCDAPS